VENKSAMKRKKIIKIVINFTAVCVYVSSAMTGYAFWVLTPDTKTAINPKFIVKDSPKEQFNWAMRFFKQNDFSRAADEFTRLTQYYPESDLAPEAQYYAGRSYEELGKYYFAFESYQKTLENYPYTKRLNEIIKREYSIANSFQAKEVPRLMDLELSESLERAVKIYGKIVENSPFGEYADKSLFKMAECDRRMFNYKEAMESYKKIISDYPESRLVPEAKYQFAYTRYEASLDPEYDQGETIDALEEFEQITKTTAVPSIAKEAKKVLDELSERKARSDLQIAEFYEKQKKYKSAIMYYEGIAANFSGTQSASLAEDKIKQLKQKVEK